MKKLGHISDHMSLFNIAKKHGVKDSELRSELKKGIKVEQEHTSNIKTAARIALDHLFEDPKYYTKLAKIKLEENVNVDKQIFESNPELASIGTLQQYSNYLSTVFPSSKIKDIVYHASPNKIEKFRDTMFGTYFSYSPIKGAYGDIINSALLNVKNPLILPKPTDSTEEKITYNKEYRNYNNPSSPYDASIESSSVTKEGIQIKIKNPEQIYILGSKQDIEGFTQYIKKKSLSENQFPKNKSSLNKDLVKEFMKHVMNELRLDTLPKINFSNDSQEAVEHGSWGGYRTGDKSIRIVTAKRHPADIFRTLAHELVHYKQDVTGRLNPGDGKTGSDIENEANSRAAIIMRNFAEAKPNLFEHLVTELSYGLENALPDDKITYVGGKNSEYTFKTDQNEYKVKFIPDGESTYERSYSTTNRNQGRNFDDTKEGVITAIKVNATVMKITLDFMKRNPDFTMIYIVPISTSRFTAVKKFIENSLPSNYSFLAKPGERENIIAIYNSPTPPNDIEI
jgi:hypothetical protein